MRVLHLLEPGAWGGDEAVVACRCAIQIAGVEHQVWLVGGTADERRAAAMGVVSTDRIAAPAGITELAWNALGSLAQSRHGGARPPDIVQCWSPGTLGLARLAFGRRVIPRACVLVRPPPPVHSWSFNGRAARKRMGYAFGDTTLLALGEGAREGYIHAASRPRGGDLMRDNIRIAPSPALAPVDEAERRARRLEARAALAIEESELVVALAAHPSGRVGGDALRFVFLLGLMFVAGHRVTGVVPSGSGHTSREEGSGIRRAARYMRAHGRRWGLRGSHLPLEQTLAAADIALNDVGETAFEGPSAGPLAFAIAASLGVPMVLADAGMAEGVLPAPVTADSPLGGMLLARSTDSRDVAARLLPLIKSAGTRAECSAMMLELARGNAAADGFRRTLLSLWQERVNVPIMRPGLPTPELLLESAGVERVGT